MRDTGLARRIRAKGVRVVEVAGWQTRGRDGDGYPVFRPKGALHHHTAGAAHGRNPSLATVLYGRPGLEGPLAQVLQSREPNPADDIAYVIAAGKANHAGVGYWTAAGITLDSNYELEGLEVEHTGYGPVPPARLEVSARIIAAMIEAPGSPALAALVAQHSEYAKPQGRKVDFRELAPFTPTTFRARVAYWVGRTASGAPAPIPTPPVEDDDMPASVLVRKPDDKTVWLLDGNGQTRREILGGMPEWNQLAVAHGVKRKPDGTPHTAFTAEFIERHININDVTATLWVATAIREDAERRT